MAVLSETSCNLITFSPADSVVVLKRSGAEHTSNAQGLSPLFTTIAITGMSRITWVLRLHQTCQHLQLPVMSCQRCGPKSQLGGSLQKTEAKIEGMLALTPCTERNVCSMSLAATTAAAAAAAMAGNRQQPKPQERMPERWRRACGRRML